MTLAAEVASALGKDPVKEQLVREQTKADIQAAIEQIDAGNFRAAVIVVYNPVTKKNHLTMHGDRSLINESAVRVLADAGLIQTSMPE